MYNSIILFKVFHNTVATNDFLFKIWTNNVCSSGTNTLESIEHFLIYCSMVTPLWTKLENYLSTKLEKRSSTISISVNVWM